MRVPDKEPSYLIGWDSLIKNHRTLISEKDYRGVGLPYDNLPTKLDRLFRHFDVERDKKRSAINALANEKGKHEVTRQKLIAAKKELSKLKRGKTHK